MMEYLEIDAEVAIRILISFGIGLAIGFEREYQSKVAGLRTMIMICLGSTIFTEISISIGGSSPDRIASNIITGIGFLGAGVIFKDGLTISGITTATTIWISAALGMAVGAGEYFIALAGCVILLIILSALQPLNKMIDRFHQVRTYRIKYRNSSDFSKWFEAELKQLNLNHYLKKDFKEDDCFIIVYEVTGNAKYFEKLNAILKEEPRVTSFEY
jgi:putative Mg2+ transporter-C (MgtC) family protein